MIDPTCRRCDCHDAYKLRRIHMAVIVGLIIAIILTIILVGVVSVAHAGALDEVRYCGPPSRNANNEIIRRADVRAAFRKIHACPSTDQHTGPCPGWQIDHVIPLASCGCDSIANMQWLPVAIKTCSGLLCKDRWERWVYTCEVTR